MTEYEIVFGFKKSGPGTTLTHARSSGEPTTLCGIEIPTDWYDDEWADGPECKKCRKLVETRQ